MKEPTESKKKEIRQLLEQFYQEYKEVITPKMYQRAKESPEYFLFLTKSLTAVYNTFGKELLKKLDIDKTHPQ